LREQELFT